MTDGAYGTKEHEKPVQWSGIRELDNERKNVVMSHNYNYVRGILKEVRDPDHGCYPNGYIYTLPTSEVHIPTLCYKSL